jgi:UDP-glucose 4-epimerase
MKSLVTGAAGFLGSHVAEELLRRGHEVVALDDLSGGFRENVPAGARFIEGSIIDHDLVNRIAAEKRFDFVFHLAAYAAEGLSHFIKRFNYTNNLIGSVNLINAAVNTDVKLFVFTSSIAVYGNCKPPMREDVQPVPEDSYGVAKLAVEQELRLAHEMWGLKYVIFRPHNVYGDRQNLGDRYRNVVGIFMNQIMQGLPMTIFGDGSQTRAFTHAQDIIAPIVDSIDIPGAHNRVFNIGADLPVSVKALAEAVALAMGVEPRVTHLPARQEVLHAFSDHSNAKTLLGYKPRVSLTEGLASMAAWARQAGVRSSQIFKDVEILKNMPESWRRDLAQPTLNDGNAR